MLISQRPHLGNNTRYRHILSLLLRNLPTRKVRKSVSYHKMIKAVSSRQERYGTGPETNVRGFQEGKERLTLGKWSGQLSFSGEIGLELS